MDTTVSVSVTDTVSDTVNNSNDSKIQNSEPAKASKHKYGKYKNVLLKDEELQALEKDYTNCQELIDYLDEYIEMKGYKAKSHYLCIKRWVVDAVKRKQTIPIKSPPNNGAAINKFTSNCEIDYAQFYAN